MTVLGGQAISYERGTPTAEGRHVSAKYYFLSSSLSLHVPQGP